jgi:hypothetical protein
VSAPASRIDTAEDALLALLQAAAADNTSGLYGVPVTMGDPGPQVRDEHVWTGPNWTSEQDWDTTGLGAQARNERITGYVGIRVQREGADFRALRDRATALMAAAALLVRSNPDLGAGVDEIFDAEVSAVERWYVVIGDSAIAMEFGLTVIVTAYLADAP